MADLKGGTFTIDKRLDAGGNGESESVRHRVAMVACVGVLVALSLWVVGTVVFCFVQRLGYPNELSWLEGCFVDQARRVAAGKPIYPPPSAEYIGMVYTPVGHFAAGALIRWGLDGFLATRLVSLFGLCGAVLLGTCLSARAAVHRWVAVMVPVLTLAAYLDVDAYMDVGRTESLLALLCVAAAGALTLRSTVFSLSGFVVAAATAIYIKQTSLILLAVLLVGVFFVHRRLAIWSAALLAAAVTGCFLIANHVTNGMFFLYTLELPSHHRFDNAALVKSLGVDFLGSFAILTSAVSLGLVALVMRRREASPQRHRYDRTFVILLLATAAAGTYAALSRWNVGGGSNVLIPYAILGAAFLPAAVSRMVGALEAAGYRSMAWPAGLALLAAAVGGGLGPLDKHLPTVRDRAEWARLRSAMATYGPPERIWIPCHGSALGSAVGDPMRPHIVTLMEYVGGTFGPETGYDFPEDLAGMIAQQYFAAIVGSDWYLLPLLEPYYEIDTRLRPFELRTMSGWHPEREAVWIPKRSRSAKDGSPDTRRE